VAGLFTGTIVFAVGQALAFPAFMSMAVRAAPASERGAVVGTFTAFFDLAFGIGALSLGAITAAAGIGGMFISAAGAAAAGLVVLLVAGKRRPDLVRSMPEIAASDAG